MKETVLVKMHIWSFFHSESRRIQVSQNWEHLFTFHIIPTSVSGIGSLLFLLLLLLSLFCLFRNRAEQTECKQNCLRVFLCFYFVRWTFSQHTREQKLAKLVSISEHCV